MSENGKNATALIAQMKLLYGEISSLLSMADKLMLKNSWEPEAGNTAIANASRHIDAPKYWIPQDIFRFYSNKSTHSNVLAYIATILYDRNNETKLEEPLLTCGWLDYGNVDEIPSWEYWYAHIHVYQKKFETDGQLRPVEAAFFYKELDKRNIKKAYTLAMPLMDITGSSLLEDKIITSFIEGIESSGGADAEEGHTDTSSADA